MTSSWNLPSAHALVAACVAEGFRVLVAAPSGERSWIGRAFSRHREVTLADYPGLGEQAWSIDGTPSDCVNIALGHLLPDAYVTNPERRGLFAVLDRKSVV